MGGKEASPTKDDAVPAGKKPAAGRRSGPLLPADEGPATTHTSVHSSSTPASAASISPTPLAQAAFDSVSGTPKSTPDRPFSDVCDKLASLDAKLSTKATIMELTAQLNAANVKATMFEDKANTIEQEMKTTLRRPSPSASKSSSRIRAAPPQPLPSASGSSSSCTSSKPPCGMPSWHPPIPTPLRRRSSPSRPHRLSEQGCFRPDDVPPSTYVEFRD